MTRITSTLSKLAFFLLALELGKSSALAQTTTPIQTFQNYVNTVITPNTSQSVNAYAINQAFNLVGKIFTSGGNILNTGPSNQGPFAVNATLTAPITADAYGFSYQSDSTISAGQVYEWAIGPGTNSAPSLDGFRGTVRCPPGTTILTCSGVAGYAVSSAPNINSLPTAVGLFGIGIADADGAAAWGFDTILADNRGQTTSSHGARYLYNETDCNITSPATVCNAFNFGGSPTTGSATFNGPTALTMPNGAYWAYAFGSANGASRATFAYVGAVASTGSNVNSQTIDFHGFDSTGNSEIASFQMQQDYLIYINSEGAGHGNFSLPTGGYYAAANYGLYVNFKALATADTGSNAFFGLAPTYLAETMGNGTATLFLNGPKVTVTGTTPATSPTTGTIIDSGGLGVAGDSYLGGILNVTGLSTFTGGIKFGSYTATTCTNTGSVNIQTLDGTTHKVMTCS